MPLPIRVHTARPLRFALSFLLCAALASCEGSNPATQKDSKGGADRTPRAAFTAARNGDVPVVLTALGTVTPTATIAIRAKVDGELLRVLFHEGQVVQKGQVIAEIDPRSYQAAFDQAKGQWMRDQAQLTRAQGDLDRLSTLFTQGWASTQQVDTQRALVRQLQGTVASDRAQMSNARLQLNDTRVVAPADGRLGLRQIDPGNIVRANDPAGIVVLTQTTPIDVLFTLPQENLPTVLAKRQASTPLTVEAWNSEKTTRLATGTLSSIDNQIDPTTGTIKLKARFQNRDDALFPNQFVNVQLHVETLHNVVTVPSAAVQTGQKGPFVYILKPDQKVAARPVVPGPSAGEQQAIVRGVAVGENVIVDGLDKLRDGMTIKASPLPAARTDLNKATAESDEARRTPPSHPPLLKAKE